MLTMRFGLLAVLALLLAPTLAAPAAAQTQSRSEIERVVKEYLAAHPEGVQRIVKDYLEKNPDMLEDAIDELIKRRSGGGNSADKTSAVKANAAALFSSPHQVTLGNPAGDVTMVEFFDYNCGFCKRALGDMVALMKAEPNLKIVLKEFPVLGPGSVEAARVAVAVRMQDPAGKKYLDFHLKLLGGRGHANKAQALTAAREAGLDMARLEKDMQSDEVRETLDESMKLARTLGVNGTPGYVVGNDVIMGAVGRETLSEKIASARK